MLKKLNTNDFNEIMYTFLIINGSKKTVRDLVFGFNYIKD